MASPVPRIEKDGEKIQCLRLFKTRPMSFPPARSAPGFSSLIEQRRHHVRIQDLEYGKLVDKELC